MPRSLSAAGPVEAIGEGLGVLVLWRRDDPIPWIAESSLGRRSADPARTEFGARSLEDVDVPLRAHLLQDLRPHGHAHLAEVRLPQQQHLRPRLPDSAP